ncbi:MAG: hypothetical protein WBZ54_07960, partial [Methylocella sp.]
LKSSSALVRAMAVWALGRLVSPDDLAEFECRWRPRETDAMVEVEWAVAGAATAPGAIDLKEGRPS